jgi:integrase
MSPAWLDAVRAASSPIEYTDTEQRGLVLRVELSGRRTWVARYFFTGKFRRFVLGTYPEVPLKAARVSARRTIGLAASGTDPQVERERLRAGEDVRSAARTWLADEKLGPRAKWKGGLEGGSARSFMPHVRAFVDTHGSKRLVELDRKFIERFVTARGTAPATRNRALTALRGFFTWAVRKGLLAADPSAGLDKEREAERARTLTDPELRALILGFDGSRYGRAVRLLALTGLRRDEVLGARWSWVDADARVLTIPPEAEKTGRGRGEPRRVALSPTAITLLADQRAALFAEGVRSEFLFPTSTGERPHSDALKPLLYRLRGRRSNGQPASTDKRAKPRPAVLPTDVSVHDVRRTVADALLNRLGVAPWVVDHVVLGHARPKLLRTYMPTLPLDEARAALSRWADELELILGASSPAVEKEIG